VREGGLQLVVNKSPEEYAATGGVSCPSCDGIDLDRAPFGYPEGGEVTPWVACESCRFVWQERYVLVGYLNLEEPQVPGPGRRGH
jgi:hypothetical protein